MGSGMTPQPSLELQRTLQGIENHRFCPAIIKIASDSEEENSPGGSAARQRLALGLIGGQNQDGEGNRQDEQRRLRGVAEERQQRLRQGLAGQDDVDLGAVRIRAAQLAKPGSCRLADGRTVQWGGDGCRSGKSSSDGAASRARSRLRRRDRSAS
jgi:hypothetical protein